MTRAQHAVWVALRDLGPSRVDAVAERVGTRRAACHRMLVLLVEAGCVSRQPLRGHPGRRPIVYTATVEPRVDSSIEAVRQVLAGGPVTGFREVVRRAGYCDHSVSRALTAIATRERRGFRDGDTTTYRLREGT